MAHGHGHGHPHGHGHGHAHHAPGPDADRRWLALALAINVGFMALEAAAGLLAGSVALLSDAAHMLGDAAALGLALVAAQLAARRPSGRFTFGLGRAEVLSAQVNGVALLVLGVLIGVEAVRRVLDPPAVDGAFVLVVGVVGALVNGAAGLALARAERRSLNVEGAMRHNLYDALSSLGAALAGLVVLLTGFARADGIAALVVVALMLRGGWGLLRDAGRVLLEGTPEGLDAERVGLAMAGVEGVVEVHDLHLWEVTAGFPALAAHVTVGRDQDCHARRLELAGLLRERFGIEHTTLQVDHEHAPELLRIERAPGARA